MDIYHWQGPEGVYREKRLIDLIGFSFMSIIKRKSIQGGIGKINFEKTFFRNDTYNNFNYLYGLAYFRL